jgi:hypothetical protein
MRGRLTSVQRHRNAITITRAVNKYEGQPDIGNNNRGIRKMLVDYNDVHASSHAVSQAHILQLRSWDATYFKILNSRGVQNSLNSFPLRHVSVLHCWSHDKEWFMIYLDGLMSSYSNEPHICRSLQTGEHNEAVPLKKDALKSTLSSACKSACFCWKCLIQKGDLKLYDIHGSVHRGWFSINTNKMQNCNRIYYSQVYWRLNMFPTAHHSSSGVMCLQSLQTQFRAPDDERCAARNMLSLQ